MRPTILLFDIDGTLITTGGAGRRALEGALAAHGAAGTASFPFAGMTDPAIVRRSLSAAGRPANDRSIAAVLAAYAELLDDEVARANDDAYRLCDGILPALDAAARRPDCAVGLGTGNIRRGAEIKLRRVGIAERFAFGGFGSDAEDRAELLRIGARRGAAELGCALGDCRVVVIGDTPRDIEAARAAGADSIAVATGPVPLGELAAHAPSWLGQSLLAPGALDALLEGIGLRAAEV